jgi:hypothetical protein
MRTSPTRPGYTPVPRSTSPGFRSKPWIRSPCAGTSHTHQATKRPHDKSSHVENR